MFCSQCGSLLPEGAQFCTNCGTKVLYQDLKKPEDQVMEEETDLKQEAVDEVEFAEEEAYGGTPEAESFAEEDYSEPEYNTADANTDAGYQQDYDPDYDQGYQQGYEDGYYSGYSREPSRAAAIVGYITWIGFIVALVIGDRNDPLTRFHTNQALVINIAAIICGVILIIPIIGWIIGVIGYILVFIGWIMGIINAAQGTMKPVPVFGKINLIG